MADFPEHPAVFIPNKRPISAKYASEIEVCKANNRQFISAEIDEKYYKMIMDRLNNGHIEEKYRLDLKRYEKKNSEAQLMLIKENESAYQPK